MIKEIHKIFWVVAFLLVNLLIISCSNPKESDLKLINKKYYLNNEDTVFSGKVEIDEQHDALFENGDLIKVIPKEKKNIDADNDVSKDLPQAVSERYIEKREDQLYYLVTSDIPFSGKSKIDNTYSATFKNGKLLNYDFKNVLSYSPNDNFQNISIKLEDIEKLKVDTFSNTSSNSVLGFAVSIEIKSYYTHKVYHDLNSKGKALKNPRQPLEIFKSSKSFFKKYKNMELQIWGKGVTKWGYTKITKPQYKIFYDRDKYGGLETEYYDRKTGSYKPKEGPETFDSLKALQSAYPRLKIVKSTQYGPEDRWGSDSILNGYFEVKGTYLYKAGKNEFIYRGRIERTKRYSEIWEGSYITNKEDRFISEYKNLIGDYNRHGKWNRYSITNGQKKLLEERFYEHGDLIASSKKEKVVPSSKKKIANPPPEKKTKKPPPKKKKITPSSSEKKASSQLKNKELVSHFDNSNNRDLLIQFVNSYYKLNYTPEISDKDLHPKILGFFNANTIKSADAPGWRKFRKNKKRVAAGISVKRFKEIGKDLKNKNYNDIIEDHIYRTAAGQELWMKLGFPYIEKD